MKERFASWSGRRAGRNHLFLFFLPDPEFISDGTSTGEVVAGGAAFELRYTWSHEGKANEGILLFCAAENGAATCAWVDSWHQSASIMQFAGTYTEEAGFAVSGSYPAPEGPDWGWRITLRREADNSLVLDMTNITPDGEESPAVHVTYAPVG
ncbi:MAG: DUF1579 domain-containing protein [Dehalococcoidia bacterium]|nr:DUF1579 domain-containing protein [Dehalococcoidia bacterium]